MNDFLEIQQKLSKQPSLEWFDSICDLLKKENHPTVSLLTNIIGPENLNIKKGNRGSKFLIPIDERFKIASINPDIEFNGTDAKLQYLSFGGPDFSLSIRAVKERFGSYLVQSNIYDGGTQIFFNSVSDEYEFTAISFYFEDEKENIKNSDELLTHSVSFHFGHKQVKLRDGYTMIN
jgi:hypothetical protein